MLRNSFFKSFNTQICREFCVKPGISWSAPIGEHTGISIYNCVAKHKVPLALTNNYISWYTCGPTVYDSAHIGHASCYVKLDIIQRILRKYFNYNIVTAMNITDIDDKIIARSLEEQVPYKQIARRYEAEFWQDMQALNVKEPNIKIRVSENMLSIIAFIEQIFAKGLAYKTQDNSVYFNVGKYAAYGKLQNVSLDEAAKIENKSYKLNSADFALWKATKSKEEPHFAAPWGAGRPGWHIECSALASTIFGEHIDIHAGGLDLRFPHHENEEAQSCVHHNCKQWVNYWLHTGPLTLKGEASKMSKSLKNTISISSMLSQYSADEFRMACLLSNYKSNMEYGVELMQLAAHTLKKFQAFKTDCEAYLTGLKTGTEFDNNEILANLHKAQIQFKACLSDDFDTAKALSVLLEQASTISRNINQNVGSETLIKTSSLDTVAAVYNVVLNALDIFGLNSMQANTPANIVVEENLHINSLLDDLLKHRLEIRQQAVMSKNKELFKICDNLRNLMQQHGVAVQDHSNGSTWTIVEKIKNS